MTDDIKSVTPEEKAEYDAFSKRVWEQLTVVPPVPLWYYTSAATFARILKTKAVWSTQISCLNDHTEFRYAVQLLRDEFKLYLQHEDEHIRFLAEHLYRELEHDGADASFFFILCMSQVRDDLSQWRAYSGGEGGVSIGFDVLKMRSAPSLAGRSILIPVRYQVGDHKAIANDVAVATLEFFRKGLQLRPGVDRMLWADVFLTAWRDHVIYFAPVLKHSSFAREEEWRLVISLHPADVKRIEIQERQALISRHLPLSFGETLPIREVVVGPCRHPSVSRISVWTYLEAQGYAVNETDEHDPTKVTVTSSKIPFQTM